MAYARGMEARRGRPPHPGVLTAAEERVFDLVRTGLTNAEIAVRLGVSINTVRYHLTNLDAKATAETRDELRGWEPGSGRNPLGLLAPLVPGLRWVAAAAGVAVVGVAAAAVIAALVNREGPPEPATPPVVVEQSPVDLPELGDDRVSSVSTLAVVAWDGLSPSVRLVDSRTGAELARTSTGYRPVVTFRRSANELLVSYLPVDEPWGTVPHALDVLDAENGLALKRRVPVADRAEHTIYWPHGQALSADERYLAVSTMTMRTELPECASRSLDGPTCAREGVRIVDLESPEPAQWWFELPRHCGGARVYPFEDSGPHEVEFTLEMMACRIFIVRETKPWIGPGAAVLWMEMHAECCIPKWEEEVSQPVEPGELPEGMTEEEIRSLPRWRVWDEAEKMREREDYRAPSVRREDPRRRH